MKNPIFGMVIIVLLLLISTNDSFAQKTEVRTNKENTTVEQKQVDARKTRLLRQVTVWQQRLDLTEEQVSLIETELDQYSTAIRELKTDENLSNEEKKAAAATLGKSYEAKFKSLLDEKQLEKYNNYRGYEKTSKERSKISK